MYLEEHHEIHSNKPLLLPLATIPTEVANIKLVQALYTYKVIVIFKNAKKKAGEFALTIYTLVLFSLNCFL
jgi:hypothetical protein